MTAESNETPRRTRPDGSAWKLAQKEMAERNDAARSRGMQERTQRERDAAIRQHLRNQERHAEL